MGVLGGGSAAGRGGLHGQIRKRMGASAKRDGRFERLKKMGGKIRQVINAAMRTAVMYGRKAVGLPLAILHRPR